MSAHASSSSASRRAGRLGARALGCALMLLAFTSSCMMRPVSPEEGLRRGMARLSAAFASERFVAYSPSAYNPLARPPAPVSEESIQQDLATLRPYFSALVTYSCSARSGLDRIVPVAERSGFKVLLGIWDVGSPDEIETAAQLARKHPRTVLGVIVGNETLLRGGKFQTLETAFRALRERAPGVPLSTSEPIHAYASEDLRRIADYHTPNLHWIFQGRRAPDIEASIEWLKGRVGALRKQSFGEKPILIKEHGFPSSPAPFSSDLQTAYWQRVLAEMPAGPALAVNFFEGYSMPWKPRTNPSPLAPSEAHWGAWESDRTPKPVVRILPRLH